MKIQSTDISWTREDKKHGYLRFSLLQKEDQLKLLELDGYILKGRKVKCIFWVVSLKGIVIEYEMIDRGPGGWKFAPVSNSEQIEPGCIGTLIYIWKNE